jgi:hypothetical protein
MGLEVCQVCGEIGLVTCWVQAIGTHHRVNGRYEYVCAHHCTVPMGPSPHSEKGVGGLCPFVLLPIPPQSQMKTLTQNGHKCPHRVSAGVIVFWGAGIGGGLGLDQAAGTGGNWAGTGWRGIRGDGDDLRQPDRRALSPAWLTAA